MEVCAKGEAAQVFHPAANIFPIDDDSIPTLADDIKANGQKVAIEMMDGQVLDGRRRWLACKIAGVQPITRVVDVDDPIAYVLSLNLHRRHLSETQRAMVAARARAVYDQQAKERQKEHGGTAPGKSSENTSGKFTGSDKGDSRDKAGEAVGVSGKSVDYATAVLRRGIPSLVQAVDSDKIAVSTAARVAGKPHHEQEKFVAETSGRPSARKNVVVEAIEPGQSDKPSVGVLRANEAIDVLKRIPRKDPLRLRGFQIVSDWIKVNSK